MTDSKNTNRSTGSLFGEGRIRKETAGESEARAEYEALAARRRVMSLALGGVVLVGIVVLVWLVCSGAWRNAAVKAEAAQKERAKEYEAKQAAQVADDEYTYAYTGYEEAKVKFEWRYRVEDRRNGHLQNLLLDAVGQKPSEICIVEATKPMREGMPEAEYEVHLLLNGEDEFQLTREDGTVETVKLSNEMDEQMLCDVILQAYAKAYGDVQWPLELAVHKEEHGTEDAGEAAPAGKEQSGLPEGIKLPTLNLEK